MRALQALPSVVVTIDGAALAARTGQGLSEVRVRQALSVPSQCELVFRDPPGPLDTAEALRPGSRLELIVDGSAAALFGGEITAVELVFDGDGGREVRVRGYDLSHRLRLRQSVRAHVKVSAASLAAEMVRDLDMRVQAAQDGPTYEWLLPHHRSDLELLVDALSRCGLFFTVADGVLHLLTLEGAGEPLALELGRNLVEARLELNGERSCGGVEVAGWDVLRAEGYRGRAGRPRSGRRVEVSVTPGSTGTGRRSLYEQGTPGQPHADALAQAELDVRAAAEVLLRGTAEGDPRLRPGALVALSGVGAALGGRHVLTAVTHTIDGRRGYLSTLDTEPPSLHARPPAAVVSEGIVTQVRDPEARGRIKARLPGYFDVETDWMQVLMLGAGSGKGLQVMPDVDDTVLVLLAHGDPAQGIVLGGLYGSRDVPDAAGVVGGAVRRFQLRTPGGQVVHLDDAARSVRAQDAAGSFVELAPHRVTVHAAADLEIAAPGRRILIRGRAIDFETA